MLSFLLDEHISPTVAEQISHQSIHPSHFGLLVRSLIELWNIHKEQNWTNRIVYLK